jgi:hypothetical protein
MARAVQEEPEETRKRYEGRPPFEYFITTIAVIHHPAIAIPGQDHPLLPFRAFPVP